MNKLCVGGDILSELETQLSIYHSKLIKAICYDVFKDPSLINKMLTKYTTKHIHSNCNIAPDKPKMERYNNNLNNLNNLNDDESVNESVNDIIITDKHKCLALVHIKRQLRQCNIDPLLGIKYCSIHNTEKKHIFGTLEDKDYLVI
jgi:hypothetical protein